MHFRQRMFAAVLMLSLAVSATGCQSAKHKLEAEAFANRYYEALRAGRIDEALDMCSSTFFATTPREDWVAKLALTRENLGALEDFKSTKWNMEILPNGTFTTFQYTVNYARFESHETITVVAPTREEGFFIFGHHIRSDGMN
jgi:hypothetical protein